MKKVLIVDDSALMRRVISGIIETTNEYKVSYIAGNGIDALSVLEKHKDVAVVLCDICMPRMGGIELLKAVRERDIRVPFVMISSSREASDTITALELGAMEFIKKPDGMTSRLNPMFERHVKNALKMAAEVKEKYDRELRTESEPSEDASGVQETEHKVLSELHANKLVALVCSTGGPNALKQVIPRLPKNLAAPVLVVQHMPVGFTATMSERLDEMSALRVKEACDNEPIQRGTVYVAKGGTHLTLTQKRGHSKIVFDDAPPVVGLKPCGNIMYHSLCGLDYDEIICVVLTGMGADGTKGIKELAKHNRIYVIAQDERSSTVYGMPKAIYESGLTDVVCDIHKIADEIVKKVGVL